MTLEQPRKLSDEDWFRNLNGEHRVACACTDLAATGVSGAVTAAFSGVMVVAADLMLIAGAAVAGKESFALIKTKAFNFFRVHGPPQADAAT